MNKVQGTKYKNQVELYQIPVSVLERQAEEKVLFTKRNVDIMEEKVVVDGYQGLNKQLNFE